jgi:hypothetical protein
MAKTTYAPRGALKAKADPIKATDPVKARCTAHNRQGRQCGKSPIAGGTVCRMHGGAAPQVKLAALERLKQYQDRAIDRLFNLIEQTDFPSTAMAGVKDVLDRTLGKAAEKVDVNVTGEIALVPARLAAARKRLAQNPSGK